MAPYTNLRTGKHPELQVLGLHHAAYRCKDSEATRAFYEDFLGLPLVEALHLQETKTARPVDVLHTFFRMQDGSNLAFFEDPQTPFDFSSRRDFDLHIALETTQENLDRMLVKGKAVKGVEVRGKSNHGFIESIYFRDPNGYCVELTVQTQPWQDDSAVKARKTLSEWQSRKAARGKNTPPRPKL